MYSISFITAQLFPKKTPEELNSLSQDCFSFGFEYEEEEFIKMTEQDIAFWEVKRNLIRTLYQLQYGYYGIASVIMDVFEEWSKKTLEFKNLTEEDQDFCQRYYMLIGFLNFAYLGRRRQAYLLGSHFLALASIWNIPVYVNVQQYFSTLTYVWEMKDDAALFSEVIKANPVGLVGEKGFKRSISNWIALFEAYKEQSFEKKVDEFLQNNMEVQRLDSDQKKLLSKVLSLYYGLVTGSIWMNIEYDETLGNEHKPKTSVKALPEYYLDALKQVDSEKFSDWLASYKDVASFIDSTKLGDDFVEKLFSIIKEKVDFKNEKQVSLLLEFINLLKQGGWNEIDKIVYFDEKVGEFVWNKEYID